MPGTPRDIAYLEDKFQTGDIPTQQDFYDFFASFVHYLMVQQSIGDSTSNVMSQKAVKDLIVQTTQGSEALKVPSQAAVNGSIGSIQQDQETLKIYKMSNFGSP